MANGVGHPAYLNNDFALNRKQHIDQYGLCSLIKIASLFLDILTVFFCMLSTKKSNAFDN